MARRRLSHRRGDPVSGKLSNETVFALEAVIGAENRDAAMNWLMAQKWITNDMAELSVERARRVFDNPDKFKKVINEAAAKAKGAK